MTLSIQNYLRSSPCARAVLYSAIAVEVVYFLSLFRALLMHLSAVLVLKLMATLVNSFIFDSSCSKTLLPWMIYMPKDDRITVQGYYEMVVSKQPGEWSRPFCSRPRVGSSKGPKPVVMRGPERVLPWRPVFFGAYLPKTVTNRPSIWAINAPPI